MLLLNLYRLGSACRGLLTALILLSPLDLDLSISADIRTLTSADFDMPTRINSSYDTNVRRSIHSCVPRATPDFHKDRVAFSFAFVSKLVFPGLSSCRSILKIGERLWFTLLFPWLCY